MIPRQSNTVSTDDALVLRELLGPGTIAADVVVDGVRVAAFGDPVGSPDVRRMHGPADVSAWGTTLPSAVEAVAVLLARGVDLAVDQTGLVSALVECQNQALSLYKVSRIQTGSLDRADVESRLLSTVGEVTRSDAVALVTENEIRSWGQPGPESALKNLLSEVPWHSGGCERHFRDEHHVALLWPLQSSPSEPAAALAVIRGAQEPYLTADIKLMTFLSDIVGSARRAVSLHEEAIAQARLGREHDAASRLAMALLPNRLPALEGCDVFHLCEPASSAGGDFFTHTTVKDSTLYFAVGDVAGKGLPAALVMAKVVGACRSAFGQEHPSAAEVMASLHNETHEYLANVGLFVTVLVGVYHPVRSELEVANAGHSPVAVVTQNGIHQIVAGAPPIGVLDTLDIETKKLMLAPGDLLFVGSDGLTEQTNPDGEMFGQDHLISLIEQMHGHPAQSVANAISAAVHEHAAGVNPADDQTMFVLRAVDQDAKPLAALTLQATTLDVRRLGPWLEALCPSEFLTSVELATHEVCINIVEHAYAQTNGQIQLTASVNHERLQIQIRDHGRPCQPELVPTPDLEEPQIRGYGLHLARRLMSRVRYERVHQENVWTLEIDWETKP